MILRAGVRCKTLHHFYKVLYSMTEFLIPDDEGGDREEIQYYGSLYT